MMRGIMPLLLLLAPTLFGRDGHSLLRRAETRGAENPPPDNARDRQAGAKLFARECAACHGRAGEGTSSAPPLRTPEVCESSPGALYWVLRNGSLRRGMPSFSHLPAQQRWQIILYLKSLAAGE